ncbi:MAG TPA: hypothetical protein VGQ85_08595 [Candidatus Limnocylindrales bacterium]|nr:hypothetical protein [Candidatus Limnocylindrales bacterium]
MRKRLATAIGVVASPAVALVLAHDLAFLARYGSTFGEALAHAGHGPAWTGAAAGSVAIGAGLFVTAVLGLRRLGGIAEQLRASGTSSEPRRRAFLRSWAISAARLAFTTTLLLTIQENLERVSGGVSAPNLGLLVSAEYPGAIPIVLGVAIAVSLVAALVAWRRAVLVSRIQGARLRPIRASIVPRPAGGAERRPLAGVRGRWAVRAPPLLGNAAQA